MENESKPGPKPKLEPTEAVLEQLRALGGIQATVEEAASVMRVCRRTLFNFFEEYPAAKDAFEDGKHAGRASLRRKQFAMADRNATMAIWLGKQYLGQADKQELTGKDGEAIEVNLNAATDELISRISRLAARARPNGRTEDTH